MTSSFENQTSSQEKKGNQDKSYYKNLIKEGRLVRHSLRNVSRSPSANTRRNQLDVFCEKKGFKRTSAMFFALDPNEGGEALPGELVEEIKIEELLKQGNVFVADCWIADRYITDGDEKTLQEYFDTITEVKSLEELKEAASANGHRREIYCDCGCGKLESVYFLNYSEIIFKKDLSFSKEMIAEKIQSILEELEEYGNDEILERANEQWREEIINDLIVRQEAGLEFDDDALEEDLRESLDELK